MKNYSAQLDTTAKLVTGFVLLLFAAMLISFTIIYGRSHDYFVLVTIYLLLGGILFISWNLHPIDYQLDKTNLIVRRPAGRVQIAFSDIQNAQLVSNEELGFAVRTFASGGLFGYFGKFWSRAQGNMMWYVKNSKKLLLIELKSGKKIVISPDQGDDMLGSIKKELQLA